MMMKLGSIQYKKVGAKQNKASSVVQSSVSQYRLHQLSDIIISALGLKAVYKLSSACLRVDKEVSAVFLWGGTCNKPIEVPFLYFPFKNSCTFTLEAVMMMDLSASGERERFWPKLLQMKQILFLVEIGFYTSLSFFCIFSSSVWRLC